MKEWGWLKDTGVKFAEYVATQWWWPFGGGLR